MERVRRVEGNAVSRREAKVLQSTGDLTRLLA